MQVSIIGRHLPVTEPIASYVREKTTRVGRLLDQLRSIESILSKRGNHTYDVELIAHVDHHAPFVAEVKHDDLYACIDLACDKIERQVRDHKEKLKSHKRDSLSVA
jgi:putative sigma-54 modulation protein